MPAKPPDPATAHRIADLRASGLSVSQLAERFGLSKNAVRQRLDAAMKKSGIIPRSGISARS